MSKEVDERVVSMQFDNKNFEKNVSTSMSTLQKLKATLKFDGVEKGFQSIEAAAKKVDISPIGKAAETVQAKFSALEVMGVTALANITNSAVNAGKSLLKSLSVDQLSAGWSKYDQKTANVQTLLNSTGKSIDEVNSYLERLMWFSDETSYGFTDMTSALAQMTAAGGDIDKLIPLITGVANSVAFAGKGATEFSRAMFNLNQSYNKGYLDYSDWKSLDLAGVTSKQLKQVLIETGEEMGKIKKGTVTLSNFASTLTDKKIGKWATTDVMEKAFGKFSEFSEAVRESVERGDYELASDAIEGLADKYGELGVKAFKSAQEAKTFQEAIDATKDAVSSGWMKTFEILFGNYEEAKETWTGLANLLWDVFASGADARNEMLDMAFNSKWSSLEKQITGAGVSLEDFEKALIKVDPAAGKIIEECGSLAEAFTKGKLKGDLIVKTLKSMIGVGTKATAPIKDMNAELEKYHKIVNKVIRGDFGNGKARVEALTKAGWDYKTVQGLVNKQIYNGGFAISDLSDAQLKNVGYTEDQIKALRELAEQAEKTGTPLNELIADLEKPSGKELIFDSLSNLATAIRVILQGMKKAWDSTFDPVTANTIYTILENINKVSKNIAFYFKKMCGPNTTSSLDKITRSFNGLFAILDILKTVSGGWITVGLKAISRLLKAFDMDLLDVTANVGDVICKFRDWLLENNYLVRAFDFLINKLVDGIIALKEWINTTKAIPSVSKNVKDFKKSFSDTFVNIKKHLSNSIKKFREFLERTKELNGVNLKNIGTVLKDFKDNVLSYFFDVDDVFEELSDSIGKAFKTFREWAVQNSSVIRGLDKLVKAVKKGLGTFKEWIHDVQQLPVVQKAITGFSNTMSKAFTNLKNSLSDAGSHIGEFFTSIFGKMSSEDGVSFSGVKSSVVTLKDQFVTDFTSMDNTVNNLSDTVSRFKEVTSNCFKSVGDSSSSLKDKISDFFEKVKSHFSENATPGDFLAAGLGISTIYSANKFSKALSTLAGPIGDLSGISKAATGVLGNFSKVLKAYSLEIKSAALINVAIAVAVLAGSLALLTLVDSKKLENATLCLGGLVLAFAALTAAIALVNKFGGDFAKGTSALLAMSGSLMILALTLKVMEDLNYKKAWQNAGLLGAMALGMAIICGVLGKVCPELSKDAGILLVFALSLKIMAMALQDMNGLKYEDLKGSIKAMSLVFLELGILGKLLSGVGFGAMGVILGAAIGLKIIISAMEDLAKVNLNGIEVNMLYLVIIFSLFTNLMIASKLAGEYAAQGGLGILAMSGALILIVRAIKLMADVSDSDMARGLLVTTALLTMFGILTAISKLAGKDAASAGTMLMQMGVALIMVASAMAIMALINEKDMWRALGAISIIMTLCAGLIAATHFAKNAKATLITLTVMITMLSGALIALSFIKPENLKAATMALSGVMVALGILIACCKTITQGKVKIKNTLLILGTLALVVGAIGVVLYYLAKQPAAQALAAGEAISLVLLSLAASMFIISNAGTVAPIAYATIGVMVLVVYALGKIMESLCQVPNIEKALVISGSLSLLIIALSGACILLGVAGTFGAGAFVGLGVLLALIVSITGLIVGIGALATYFPQLEEFLNKGIPLLGQIGYGIGSFVGNLIGGVLGGMSSGLPEIGTNLSEFMTNLQPFLLSVKMVDQDTVDATSNLAKLILIMSAAEFINGITSTLSFLFGTSDLEAFGNKLVPFGKAMVAYSDVVAGNIDADAINASSKAGKTLSELAKNLPNEGGWMQKLLGTPQDLEEFGKKLEPFGKAMVAYSDTVAGKIDSKAVTSSAKAGETLVELVNNLPKEGGWLQKITGIGDLSGFSESICKFGTAIVKYSDTVKGCIDGKAVEASVNAGKLVNELATSIPKVGGMVQGFNGTQDLGQFGTSLTSFGNSLVSYSNSLKDKDGKYVIDANAVNASVNVGKMLTTLASTIPQTGGLKSLWSGDAGIDSFGEKLVLFGNSMKLYSIHISKIDTAKMSSSVVEFTKLVNVAKGLQGLDLGQIKTFGTNLTKLGNSGIQGFIDAFKNGTTNAANAVKAMVRSCVVAIMDKYEAFNTAGKKCMSEFIAGVTSATSGITTPFTKNVQSALNTIWDFDDDFDNTGAHLVVGFKNGIDKNVYKAVNSAKGLGDETIKALRKALDIHSPSKKAGIAGSLTVDGYVNSIIKGTKAAASAGTELGKSAITGMQTAIAKATDAVNSGIDAQPTIRPIMDLSEIEAGASRINSIFSRDQAMSINAFRTPDPVEENQNGLESMTSSTSYNFTQNNYSPKALSRIDIYRQTNNQFSALRRLSNA